MYDEIEVKISRKYLDVITETLDEPIVMLGGWAVYLSVNERYRNMTGRDYIGSRDIDLGFHLEDGSASQTLMDVINSLEEKLNFSPLSFRFFKEVHRETGVELDPETARKTPSYDIFPMYVDLIVDNIPESFREIYGYDPVDEPLLKILFINEEERKEINFLGKVLWLPSSNVLLATKLKSYPSRDKDHKRIKDMCDIISLLLFTDDWRSSRILNYIGKEGYQRFLDSLRDVDIVKASSVIDLDIELIRNAMNKFLQ
jgi:hypothetical protein